MNYGEQVQITFRFIYIIVHVVDKLPMRIGVKKICCWEVCGGILLSLSRDIVVIFIYRNLI